MHLHHPRPGDEIHGDNENCYWVESIWWYMSFAFPAIAGAFGPIASAFSICSLIRPWIKPSTGEDLNNWNDQVLVISNAIQLSLAVGANVLLLVNVIRGLKSSIALPLTIAGWYISAFVLAALAIVGSQRAAALHFEFVWLQAYYYCMYSAIVYFLVASFLLSNYIGGRRGRHDHNTTSQASVRTLMAHTILYLTYLLFGALLFSRIEGWVYLDGVYWAQTTLLTIGLGDIVPTTTAGRALLVPYSIGGVVLLGLTLAAIRRLVLAGGRTTLSTKKLCRARNSYLQELKNSGSRGTHIITGRKELEQTYRKMREVQWAVTRQLRWTEMAISISVWLVLWLLGGTVFMICEAPVQDWTFFNGIYFAFVSLMTIGYGDLHPESSCGRSFFVFWTLLAVPVVTILISNAEDSVVRIFRDLSILAGNKSTPDIENKSRERFRVTMSSLGPEEIQSNGLLGAQGLISRGYAEQAPPGTIIRSRRKYQVTLIDGIRYTISRLEEDALRSFNFYEWMALMEMIGEQGRHRTASRLERDVGEPVPAVAGQNTQTSVTGIHEAADRNVGLFELHEFEAKSPINGPREEICWILERLTKALKNELDDMAREEGMLIN
ncbi:hypothetical protein BKA67DRAFT_695807 [Truncatella angustata]|uniref:Potassium channel domain-containing protein n=1 Tax=Truncatella angustata TaxID=152316 RepID=A0A9P8RHE1_9PEZI|nr:uncharacterized protein BKA67DRAFT_695807 [Truncatella angustata]KAH6645854.1 hypothetical protein BKA67DRAFT_695807 [Truncatella angustata]